MGPSLGNPATRDTILAALDSAGVAYELIEHAPLTSSAHAAALRGTPLAIGGKSLVMKADGAFHVVAASTTRASRSLRACAPARS